MPCAILREILPARCLRRLCYHIKYDTLTCRHSDDNAGRAFPGPIRPPGKFPRSTLHHLGLAVLQPLVAEPEMLVLLLRPLPLVLPERMGPAQSVQVLK